MRSIGVLFIVLGLFYVVLGAPVFGTYDCNSVQFPINNNAILASGGRYGIAVRSGNSYSILQQFNLTGNTLPGVVYTPYFTVYSGQTYALLDLAASTPSIIDTAPALDTCPLTLADIANEATRVVNVARASNGIIYRNPYLDQAAANLVSTQSASINPIYANDTAPGTTTATFIAGTGSVPNPGSTVQSLFTSAIANATRQAREMGVYYDSTAARLGYVFASRNIACGNGVLDGSDQCDDANTVSGDGCSSTCQIEGGYTCTQDAFNPVSVCTRSSNVTTSPSASVSTSRNPVVVPTTGSSASPSSTTTASRAIGTSTSISGGAAPSTSGNNPISSSPSTAVGNTASASVGSSNSNSPSISGSNSASRSVGAASDSPSSSTNGLASLTTDPNFSPSSSNSEFVLAPATTGSTSSLRSWMKVLF